MPDDHLVHICFGAIAQGDQLGVEFATEAHRNLLKQDGLSRYDQELVVSNAIWRGATSLQGLVIDDFFSIEVINVGKKKPKPERPCWCLDLLKMASWEVTVLRLQVLWAKLRRFMQKLVSLGRPRKMSEARAELKKPVSRWMLVRRREGWV